jgi:cysteine dioxygenase
VPGLAVYTPPNVAKSGCNMFIESNGQKLRMGKCGYFSAYGKLLKEEK